MRVSISNIAWDPSEDAVVAGILAAHGVDAIDVAPDKYFPEPARATPDQIAAVRAWWKARGIAVVGMQALLFGTRGLNLFGDVSVRDRMLVHLAAVCRIARGLRARRLVFGSPRQRDRGELAQQEADRIAIPFFRRLGEIAARHGVWICLEPNPVAYGANYMTTTAEAAAVVRAVSHPSIRLQLDTGALWVNGEDAAAVIAAHADVIGHVHASEPGLRPLGAEPGVDHASVAAMLRTCLPDSVVTVEMLPDRDAGTQETIARALRLAVACYGGGAAVSGAGHA